MSANPLRRADLQQSSCLLAVVHSSISVWATHLAHPVQHSATQGEGTMTVVQQQHSHCGSIWGHAFMHFQGVLPMHQHILTINIPLVSAMCAVVSACACCLQIADDTATATDVPEASAHVNEPAPSPAGSAEAHGTPAPMPGSAIGGLTPVLGQTPGAGQNMFRGRT